MSFTIEKITMACTNISKMPEFYSKVFNTPLKEHNFGEFKMYSAKIGDLTFLFCPNEIAGVDANQSRHQFDYIVENINEVIKAGLESGGSLHSELQENDMESFVTLLDPDGNTINFIQKKVA